MELAVTGPPVFVGVETTSYSGATLLSFMLNAHPSIATIGEMNGLVLKNPDEYVCSCGKAIKTCEFWQGVSAGMKERGFEFDLADFRMAFRLGGPQWMQRLRAGSFAHATLDSIRDTLLKTLPGERRQFRALVARNQAFVETVLKLTHKCVFVDTSKDDLRARALRMFSDYDVRVIHLVRDPRGVVLSKMRRLERIGVDQAARQWVRLHTRLQNLLGVRNPDKYIRVRYEDLCQDPRGMIRKLYVFCETDPEFENMDFRSAPHHIVGNSMRLEKPSTIRLDERWRELLTDEQQKVVWRIAGKLGSQYGYSA